MRLHITLADDLVRELDRQIARGERSAFIALAVERELERTTRRRQVESAFGSIPDFGHDWDEDPAAWVAEQRRLDPRRVG